LQAALRPAPKRVGFLLPLACTAMDWAYAITALYAFSNLLCAQVDVEPVCREELLAGRETRASALAVRNGRHVLRFAPATNDDPGTWTVELTELAGGLSARAIVTLQ